MLSARTQPTEHQICRYAIWRAAQAREHLNIYSTGVVNVDVYAIGSSGTGRIYITDGGVMKVTGDVTSQANADIVAGKIAGAGGASVVATFNAGENKTYIMVGEAPPPGPPPAPGIDYVSIRQQHRNIYSQLGVFERSNFISIGAFE